MLSVVIVATFLLQVSIGQENSGVTCANIRCAGPCLDTAEGPKCCSLDQGCSSDDYLKRNCIKCDGVEYDNECYAICAGNDVESEQCSACVQDSDCKTAGCSGELCVPKDSDISASICIFKCEYKCKKFQTCAKNDNGDCVWSLNASNAAEYEACMKPCKTTKLGAPKDCDVNDLGLHKAAEAVREEVIAKAPFAKIKFYDIVSAQKQVVAGINYCIKIRTEKEPKEVFTHICVWAKLDETYELQGIQFDKTLEDVCDFSCKEDPKICQCPLDYNPICCKGNTYSNPCSAECKGGITKPAEFQSECYMGECRKCKCQKIYRPICCNGKTYSNPCLAECYGIAKPAEKQDECSMGECPKLCACPAIYEPVCCNGRQFSNNCMAKCNGETNCVSGECKEL